MVDELVRTLGLAPHLEGGLYRETWRTSVPVDTPRGSHAEATGICTMRTEWPPGRCQRTR
ncbi:cupin domain-containing protein [Archangium minus]|uniref:Cupin domain-containing protein n=1 Tax=Archangium minus TaxID=83450 RepID=A0ABY9X662_9BACT|nr:cupin domain-containing protein [Archangium minus]